MGSNRNRGKAPLPQAASGKLIEARAQSPQSLVSPCAVVLFRRALEDIGRPRSDRSSISSSSGRRRGTSFQRRRRWRQLLLWWDG